MSKTKRCPRCGETKPIDDFSLNRSRADGRGCWCRSCRKGAQARYRRDNKAKIAARAKEYRRNNKAKIAARLKEKDQRQRNGRRREKYRTDPECRQKMRARSRAHYDANRAHILAAGAAYSQTPKGKATTARKNHKRRERMANAENTLTAAEWQDILDKQGNRCALCGREFTDGDPPTRDHIIPVSKGGGLTRENVQALHRSCNSRKGG